MKIIHFSGDLFSQTGVEAWAHCVGSDLHMGAGIARIFKDKYGVTNEMRKAASFGIGSIPNIVDPQTGIRIYYLCTKIKTASLPTLKGVELCLINMKNDMKKRNIKTLAIPRIGAGLDRLDWKDVFGIIYNVFRDYEVAIIIVTLQTELHKFLTSDLNLESRYGDKVTFENVKTKCCRTKGLFD